MSVVRKITGVVVSLVVVAGVALAVIYQQELRDQWTVRHYQPSLAVAELAERSGLSERGTFYLYAGKTELASAAVFNSGCERVERSNPVLGCYVAAQDKIYIYDIEDSRLDGIKEVTAAHEMLHVVFARLSQSEVRRLTDLLETAYASHKTPELEQRMAYYAKAEPGNRVNELHSIVGTELRDIGSELEAYYARYFTDRQKTVALYEEYQLAFTSIEQEIERLRETTLRVWLPGIEQDTAVYQAEVKTYQEAVALFNQRAEAGDFASQEVFSRERASLVARSEALARQQRDLASRVAAYNASVEEINRLGGQMSELSKSLDSFEEMGS